MGPILHVHRIAVGRTLTTGVNRSGLSLAGSIERRNAPSEHLALDAQRAPAPCSRFPRSRCGWCSAWDALGTEHHFCRRHFPLAGSSVRVARIRPPLLADLLQPDRVDGQPEQLAAMRPQALRQSLVLEVFLGQRIIGRADAVMQRQVQAGRRLAERDTPPGSGRPRRSRVDAVVVGQRVVRGVDAALVGRRNRPCRAPGPSGACRLPSSRSSGSMKGANTSSISAPLSASAAPTSLSMHELITTGRTPCTLGGRPDLGRRLLCPLELSTKGIAVADESRPVNWVSRLWPMVSAVMPVPSEM